MGTERKAVAKFTEDLIQKRKEASPLFRTVAIRKPAAPSRMEAEGNFKTYRKKDEVEDPLCADSTTLCPAPPLLLPLHLPGPYVASRLVSSMGTKKRKKQPSSASSKPKDQPTTSQDKKGPGKGAKRPAGSLQLPNRSNWCGCMGTRRILTHPVCKAILGLSDCSPPAVIAARHPLVGNCLWCGKVVCAQEGEGPCLFCGNPVGEAPGVGRTSSSQKEVRLGCTSSSRGDRRRFTQRTPFDPLMDRLKPTAITMPAWPEHWNTRTGCSSTSGRVRVGPSSMATFFLPPPHIVT